MAAEPAPSRFAAPIKRDIALINGLAVGGLRGDSAANNFRET
jgi:hypothetical protein